MVVSINLIVIEIMIMMTMAVVVVILMITIAVTATIVKVGMVAMIVVGKLTGQSQVLLGDGPTDQLPNATLN